MHRPKFIHSTYRVSPRMDVAGPDVLVTTLRSQASSRHEDVKAQRHQGIKARYIKCLRQ